MLEKLKKFEIQKLERIYGGNQTQQIQAQMQAENKKT